MSFRSLFLYSNNNVANNFQTVSCNFDFIPEKIFKCVYELFHVIYIYHS